MISVRCYNHRERIKPMPCCHTCQRLTVEHRITTKAVTALLKAGYFLNVDNGGRIEELDAPTNARDEILRVMGETDEEYLTVYRSYLLSMRIGWVRFIRGNNGWDVISDSTINLKAALKSVEDYIDSIAP